MFIAIILGLDWWVDLGGNNKIGNNYPLKSNLTFPQ